MEHVYPPGPTAVPPNLTAATAAYKRHAWLAMLGLAAFIALYFALSAFFTWTAYRLFTGMFAEGGNFDLWAFASAVGATFLAIFMLKALFFIEHRFEIDDIEVTREEQPRLFEFIDRLADEARAPRAHKVYLSPRVNAAVFYDLSLLNLIIPSRKNLEIGLGLVNVVSLGELKAVLAHEFGHFAQRSMAVGRWVYIARQIAGHVVSRRDALDKLLAQLSRLDLRVAWIGWLLSIIVWSIRSMMDVLFRMVLLAERALSRQMEFQADLVAVSLTGSDALIHALHKLNAADDAWDKTMSFANGECRRKHAVHDLFAVQTRIIDRMRQILNQPDYGSVPPLPPTARESHRVFKTELAQPPRMWSTHPPSSDREANAKQRYVAAEVDERSAWTLFRDEQALKEKMSAHVFRNAEVQPVAMAETLVRLDKEYGRAFLDPAYRGAYLNRSPVRTVETPAALYGPPIATADLPRVLESLYPESLADEIEELYERLDEKHALQALRDEVAQAPGGVIRHRGRTLSRADLPRVIETLDRDIATVRARIEEHDRQCRTAHLSAARVLGRGWPEYLQGLAALLHYADHSAANLRDAQGHVGNIYAIVTADGRVSQKEMFRLLEGCQALYRVLSAVHAQAAQVTLDRTVARRLEVESWPALLEAFELPPPTHDNIGQWIEVIDSWVGAAGHSLGRLSTAALEQLLLAESQVARFTRAKLAAADAPPPSVSPREFEAFLPGKERPRQKKLDWWDRFQTADGWLPGTARSIVAVGIVGAVVALGGRVGTSHLTIFNALAMPVRVEVAGQSVQVPSRVPVTVEIPASGGIDVRAFAHDDREIESFEEVVRGANANYVYSVAGAAPLFDQAVTYYSQPASIPQNVPQPRMLGAARWLPALGYDHVFEDAPETIRESSSSSTNTYRRVLGSAHDAPPEDQLSFVSDEAERSRLALAHARWDATDSQQFASWLEVAAREPAFGATFADRLRQSPHDVVLGRFEQDMADGEALGGICARRTAQAQSKPDSADAQYLAIRCESDLAAQGDRMLAAYASWPAHPWITYAAAAVHADRGNYTEAERLYEKTTNLLAAMREYSAMETARMQRLNRTGDASGLRKLAAVSQRLTFYSQIETGDAGGEQMLVPFALVANAQLADATKHARQMGEDGHNLLRLIAVSEGATREMIDTALALPVDDANPRELLHMYALSVRAGRSPARYADALRRLEEGDIGVAFLETLRDPANAAHARASLPPLRLHLRLTLLNAALVLHGYDALPDWRAEVERGLFVGERGYIGRRVVRPATSAPTSPPASQPGGESDGARGRPQGMPARIIG